MPTTKSAPHSPSQQTPDLYPLWPSTPEPLLLDPRGTLPTCHPEGLLPLLNSRALGPSPQYFIVHTYHYSRFALFAVKIRLQFNGGVLLWLVVLNKRKFSQTNDITNNR